MRIEKGEESVKIGLRRRKRKRRRKWRMKEKKGWRKRWKRERTGYRGAQK